MIKRFMKTKLDLYLAVQDAAQSALDLKPKEAEAKLESVLKPLNLAPDDRAFATQLYHSRRQRMLDLKSQELTKP